MSSNPAPYIRRLRMLSAASLALSFLITSSPVSGTKASASDCSPSTRSFVGVGTSDISSQNYGIQGENYTELRFTSTGTCSWLVPVNVTSADVALVGGGGGGGSGSRAGGGGAGELAYKTDFTVSPSSSISITVGAGGVGGVDNVSAATSGDVSSFGSVDALGGGYGAGRLGTEPSSGGSAGGARGFSSALSATLATTTVDDFDFVRLANNGGGTDGSSYGAGGGGAGSAAFALAAIYSADPSTEPNGGDSFTVFGHELAGGGSGWAGGAYDAIGGGSVGGSNSPVRPAANNTGSGGAAGPNPSEAGNGARGVVIVRFLTPPGSSNDDPDTLAATGSNSSILEQGIVLSGGLVLFGLSAIMFNLRKRVSSGRRSSKSGS